MIVRPAFLTESQETGKVKKTDKFFWMATDEAFAEGGLAPPALPSSGGVSTRRRHLDLPTQTPHELHETSTRASARTSYSELVMQGAFVVRLSKMTEGSRLAGLVEEVDTGKQARFLSESELIGFLRERFTLTLQSRQKEGKNERNDDRQ